MRLATRYTWTIVLGRVLKKIKRKLKKAAPRFELGIKDLQSSALPLGHAAEMKFPFPTQIVSVKLNKVFCLLAMVTEKIRLLAESLSLFMKLIQIFPKK